MRSRLAKAVDHFVDVRTKSDWEIARFIRDMEIDIAVDLMGFTTGARFNVFAMRPAPLQGELPRLSGNPWREIY